MASSRSEDIQPPPPPLPQQTIIETPRVILRGARSSDVDDLFECFSDSEVMRYWESLPHAEVAVTKTWVDKMINGKQNGITDFVICLKPTHNHTTVGTSHTITETQQPPTKVIGKVGIWHDDEIGFLLNRAYWRQGLAWEILPEVLDLAFNLGHGLADGMCATRYDVVADVDPRNTASLGILQKLGFEVYATEEKTFKVGDEWVDSAYLKLLKDRWLERRQAIRDQRAIA